MFAGGFQAGQEGAFDLKGVGQLVAPGLKRRFPPGEPEVEPDQMFDVFEDLQEKVFACRHGQRRPFGWRQRWQEVLFGGRIEMEKGVLHDEPIGGESQ